MSVIDDSWYQPLPGLPSEVSAGGIVARSTPEGMRVALVLENRTSGAYVLPKGHIDPGESAEEAACREIEEEAGLSDLQFVAELGIKERLNFRKTAWKVTHYYLFWTEQKDGTPTDPHIDYELGWFPLDELPPIFWPEQKALIEDNRDRICAIAQQNKTS